MKLIFWMSFLLVLYAYFGYALLLWLQARLCSRPVQKKTALLNVSIVIAARNEQDTLPAKLENLRQLDYPPDKLQIVIASDGSTDRTEEILRNNTPAVLPVILDRAEGKASALNRAVACATGDILVFLDARQFVDRDAIVELVQCFADPQVGAASGELLLETGSDAQAGNALGLYWRLEKVIRRLESLSGSVVGATGAIYAIRRHLYTQIPPGTILDDVFVPLNVARQGMRVVFVPSAIARDRLFSEPGKEFGRKVRTLTGNYQLVRIAPWVLTPANPLLFRFVSHKLLRLLVPLLLAIILVISLLIPEPTYRTILLAEVIFYIVALVGLLSPRIKKFRPVSIASTFLMLNLAATVSFYNFLTGRDKVWVR